MSAVPYGNRSWMLSSGPERACSSWRTSLSYFEATNFRISVGVRREWDSRCLRRFLTQPTTELLRLDDERLFWERKASCIHLFPQYQLIRNPVKFLVYPF